MSGVLLATLKRVEAQLRVVPSVLPIAQEVCDLILVFEGRKIPRVVKRPRLPRAPKAPPPPPPQRVASPPDYIGEMLAAGQGARALLLEILRRAAYDWVLYRSSTRIEHKQLAEDAFTWLFQEDEEHQHWDIRDDEGKQLTSFLSICEELDLDADVVRRAVRNLTLNRVVASGRPPTKTKQRMDGAEAESTLCLPFSVVEQSFEDTSF